ncbi:hypothetical protein DICPUDRAFT_149224 [Dictyostelium purpureum]|uniref:Uncharacterized protein n=1 Tax=Dictyostelium purpureum TaxID=5786 RepID=F0ZD48_DICPU|nr:uncharacterized protein DICPUDRAFT_149224 [Dictyostelium purpureum]EGC38140.1 hypothetical protein DICPUDRAFT_149224 [Dictyostelium purpureum]|eukprot:XP_003285354.1 hypothetical protein DICPUDRAFT_149224 [Dictyostelium purpureum]
MNFATRAAIRVSTKVRVSPTFTTTASFSKVPASFAASTNNVPSSSTSSSTPIASFSTKSSPIINNPNFNKNSKSVSSIEFLLSSDDDGV